MMYINSYKKGISLLLSVLIVAVLMATGLAVATILIVQLRTSILAEDSVKAVYAGEVGVECTLYNLRKPPVACPFSPLTNGAQYIVSTTSSGSLLLIKSIGTSGGARRALEISY